MRIAERGYSRNGGRSWLEQAWHFEVPTASGLGSREGEGEACEPSRRGRRELGHLVLLANR